ncbi:MAG: FprA family A-type flavoprotein [bacterium]|nr:FprA family A-type flavoprotein [bacterium]
MSTFSAVKLTDRVYWVGAIDWNLRDFHGYSTGRGSTYNAYLILGDKVTLIDTAKPQFAREVLDRIASVIPPDKIDYVMSLHSEMDHSGSIPEIVKTVKPEKVFASKNGVKNLSLQMSIPGELTEASDGEVIDLGSVSLKIYETRMLHWPDSMMAFLPEEKILFSQDGFGMHLASYERFCDEVPRYVVEHETAKYFANILTLYANNVKRALDNLADVAADIEYIAPAHGPVWRRDLDWVLGKYAEWAEQKPNCKAVVIYATMWNSTEKMALAIGEGLRAGGTQARIMSLSHNHRSDAAKEVLESGGLIIGSPTMNNQVHPRIADCVTYLKGLKPTNLVGAAFGSFGWSGEAVKYLETEMDEMNVERVCESIRSRYVPSEEQLTACRDMGLQIAKRLEQLCEI